MKLKEKWWLILIALVIILGVIAAIKYLPVYVIIVAAWSVIFGAVSGWYIAKYYNKPPTAK